MAYHRINKAVKLPEDKTFIFGCFLRYGVVQIESIERLQSVSDLECKTHSEFIEKCLNFLEQKVIRSMELTFGTGIDRNALHFNNYIKRRAFGGLMFEVRCETFYNVEDRYICCYEDAKQVSRKQYKWEKSHSN